MRCATIRLRRRSSSVLAETMAASLSSTPLPTRGSPASHSKRRVILNHFKSKRRALTFSSMFQTPEMSLNRSTARLEVSPNGRCKDCAETTQWHSMRPTTVSLP